MTEEEVCQWNAVMVCKKVRQNSWCGLCFFLIKGVDEVQFVFNKSIDCAGKQQAMLLGHKWLLMEMKKQGITKVLLWTKDRNIYRHMGSSFRPSWFLQSVLEDIRIISQGVQMHILRKQHNLHQQIHNLAHVAATTRIRLVWP